MMDEPTTPAALPRNREADEWRARYEAAERDLCRLLGETLVPVQVWLPV